MARIIEDVVPYSRPAIYVGPKTGVPKTTFPVWHPPKPTGGGAGAGGGGGAAGAPKGPPDYMALLKGSPAYQAWLASRNARLGGLATNRAAAIRSLILQYGGLPAGFKDTLHDLRPEDLAAAGANQFGATQSIQRAYDQGREQMHRSLAARGMLQSGDLGYGEGQATLERGRAENEASNSFMQSLNEAIGNWTTGSGDINAEESGLITNLLPQIRDLYPYDPGNTGGGGGGGGGGAAPPAAARTAVASPRTATRSTLRNAVRPRRTVRRQAHRPPRLGRRP